MMEETSGRYPYKSFRSIDMIDYALGKKTFDYQTFLDAVKKFKDEGLTDAQIARYFGFTSASRLLELKYIARYKLREEKRNESLA